MSTPAITAPQSTEQPNPQTMPMEDLRQAAAQPRDEQGRFMSPAVAEPAPVAAPAAPAEPAPYQIQKSEDGTVQITLQTGEVFKGTQEQVLEELTKSAYNTKVWGRDLNQKVKTYEQQLQQFQQPAQPQVQQPATEQQYNPQQFAAEYLDALANDPVKAMEMAMQHSPLVQQFQQTIQQFQTIVEQQKAQMAAAEFHRMATDFPATSEAVEKLTSVIDELGLDPHNPNHLYNAHLIAKAKGMYQPIVPASQQQKQQPPPLVNGGATPTSQQVDPYSLPLDQLRQQILSGQR